MIRNLLLLTGGVLACWALTAPPATLWDDAAYLHSAVAAAACLVPALLTLVVVQWAGRVAPEQQALLALAGSGVRMFVVLLVAFMLVTNDPRFQSMAFTLWLLLFYLVTLALEVVLLTRRLPVPQPTLQQATPSE